MSSISIHRIISRAAVLSLAAVALATANFARADSVVVNNIPYPDAAVQGVVGEDLIFTANGKDLKKPLSQVSKITLKDDPALTAAEEAYAARDWAKAAEGYERVVRSTSKPWLKDWCAVRLLDAANKSSKFDAAVRGYIELARKNPAAARAIKLNFPKPESTYLADAVNQLKVAIDSSKGESKSTLQNLLVEVLTAKGDTKAATELLGQVKDAAAADPGAAPDAGRVASNLKLATIKAALAAKDYDKVIATVQNDSANIEEPAAQAEALLAYADAKAAKLGESTDASAWKETGLAYARILTVAPAGSSTGASALLKLAALHEKRLGEPKTALALYKQIADEYKGQDAAKEAQTNIDRLK